MYTSMVRNNLYSKVNRHKFTSSLQISVPTERDEWEVIGENVSAQMLSETQRNGWDVLDEEGIIRHKGRVPAPEEQITHGYLIDISGERSGPVGRERDDVLNLEKGSSCRHIITCMHDIRHVPRTSSNNLLASRYVRWAEVFEYSSKY